MAKIADLTVDTAKFVAFAVNGAAVGTTSVIAANPIGGPVRISASANLKYTSSNSGQFVEVTVSIKRASDGTLMVSQSYTFQTLGGGTTTGVFNYSVYDTKGVVGEQYTIDYNVSLNGGTFTHTDSIAAFYMKK
jgi:hypothetical protein